MSDNMQAEIDRQTIILNDLTTRYYGYTSRTFGCLSTAMTIIFIRCMIKHLRDRVEQNDPIDSPSEYVLRCVELRRVTMPMESTKLVELFGMEVS